MSEIKERKIELENGTLILEIDETELSEEENTEEIKKIDEQMKSYRIDKYEYGITKTPAVKVFWQPKGKEQKYKLDSINKQVYACLYP